MTSTCRHFVLPGFENLKFCKTEYVSKLRYSVDHGIGYQPSKFQCSRMSGSNFMDGGGKDPPVLQRDKNAQCLKG